MNTTLRVPANMGSTEITHSGLGDIPSMGRETLQNEVMARSGIREPKYFDKVFRLAMDQRVVQTTMDRNGRIVAMLIPS